MTQSGIEDFIAENGEGDEVATGVATTFVDSLKSRINLVKEQDLKFKVIKKQIRRRKKLSTDSDLTEFME